MGDHLVIGARRTHMRLMWALAMATWSFALVAGSPSVRAHLGDLRQGGAAPLQQHSLTDEGAWYLYLPVAIQHSGATHPTPLSTASATNFPPGTPGPSATLTDEPPPTGAHSPTDAPTPMATGSPTPVPGPEWLAHVNMYRRAAGLPDLTEQSDLTEGAVLHSRYMVKNGQFGHTEDPRNPWYSAAGKVAAENGNVYVSGRLTATHRDALNLWMTGPFHMLGIVDPRLTRTGYGDYTEDIGTWKFAATINVLSVRDRPVVDITFPVFYPADGAVLPNRAYAGGESPDPLTSCSGYDAPTGPPIALQLGAGNATPNVRSTRITQAVTELVHCKFDQTDYQNPDSGSRDLGRGILRMRSAVVIMPRATLQPGAEYEIEVDNSGTRYRWIFTAAGASTRAAAPQRMSAPAPRATQADLGDLTRFGEPTR